MGSKKSNSGYVSIWLWKKYFSEFDLRYSKSLNEYHKGNPVNTTLKKVNNKPPKDPNDRAVVRVGERVFAKNYPKKKYRTAVITGIDRGVKIRYDYNSETESFGKKRWIVGIPKGHPPFIGIQKYPPLCGKVHKTNSYIGIWFDNIEISQWVKTILKPYDHDTTQESGIIKYKITSIAGDGKESFRYGVLVKEPEINTDKSLWKDYFWGVLDFCKDNKIDYVGIPWITDMFEISGNLDGDIAQIGFEMVLSWMKANKDYHMKVLFICTSIYQYNMYSNVITKHKCN